MSVVEEDWNSRPTTPVHEPVIDGERQMSNQAASLPPAVPSSIIPAHSALSQKSPNSFRSELEAAQHQHRDRRVPGAFPASTEQAYDIGSHERVNPTGNVAAASLEITTPVSTNTVDTGDKGTIKHEGSSENWLNGLLKWGSPRLTQALSSSAIGRTQTPTRQTPRVKRSIVHEARPVQQQAPKPVPQTTTSTSNTLLRSVKTITPTEDSRLLKQYEKHLTKPLRKTIVSRAALEKLHIEFINDEHKTTLLVDKDLQHKAITEARELSLELCKL